MTSYDRRVRAAERRRRRNGHKGLKRGILVAVVLTPVLLAALLGGALALGFTAADVVRQDLPDIKDQPQVPLAQTSRIFAADGSLLAYLHATENRTVIPGEQIPVVMKHATVAIEDERFYEHKGVDPQGILRALYKDLEAGRAVEGASTITQQLVGNLYLDRSDTSFTRKIHEAALAIQLETKLSKDEILNQYLNTVYYGSNAYGIETAARTYFDKEPADLTLSEAAMLAGLPQRPTAYSPRQHPAAAKARRNDVLKAMLNNGYITYDQYLTALAEPLNLAKESPYTRIQEPYVVSYVRKQLIDMFGQDAVFKGGLTVSTTINPAYQQLARQAISSILDRPGDPAAAVASVDTRTGWVRAMASSTDFKNLKYDLAVQGRRQPGSAFKTFALVAAVEAGMDPESTYYESAPVTFDIPGSRKPWSVQTYAHDYYGWINLVDATLKSDNTVYAQLAMDLGAPAMVKVAHSMGITSPINEDPAIVLGGLTYGVSPLEMASAYATLPAQGKHIEPTLILKVTDSTGKVVYQAKPKQTQAISAYTAYTVTKILEQNVRRGTGTRAQLDRPAAGKTGTATDYSDAWFCGFIPQLSTSVWVGYPQGQVPMRSVHGIRVAGGTFPAMIWEAYMSRLERDFTPTDFAEPPYDPNRPTPTTRPSPSRTSGRHTTGTRRSTRRTTTTTVTGEPPATSPTTQPPTTNPSKPKKTTTTAARRRRRADLVRKPAPGFVSHLSHPPPLIRHRPDEGFNLPSARRRLARTSGLADMSHIV